MREQGSRTPAKRVGRVLLVVAAVLVVAGLILSGVDEVLAGGSNSAGWVSIAIDVLLLVVLAAAFRSSRRG